MRHDSQALIFAAAALPRSAPSTASADVQLTMQDGRVSLVAKDATVRQILTEWARVGQTKIVNVERIPGGPMTLELNNVPEAQALDVLLRSVSGYLAAPRAGATRANLSRFDRIIVMPTLAGARPPAGAAPPPPAFQQSPQFSAAARADDDDDDAAGRRMSPVPPRARPGLQHVPAAAGRQSERRTGRDPAERSADDRRRAAAGARPPSRACPAASSVPGMVVQPPQPPRAAAGQPASRSPVRRPRRPAD